MRDDPNGIDLLETARTLLRTELIGLLPPERRGQALMIANAMAIAARQLATGNQSDLQELEGLRQLLAVPPFAVVAADALRPALVAWNGRLGDAIRDGRADPGSALHADTAAFLLATARRKVEESNPKYLAPADAPGALAIILTTRQESNA